MNNVVNVEYVEEKTQQKVTAYNVALTPDADKSGKVEGDTIDVFHPPAAELPPAEQPPTVAPVEKVAAESQDRRPVRQRGDHRGSCPSATTTRRNAASGRGASDGRCRAARD